MPGRLSQSHRHTSPVRPLFLAIVALSATESQNPAAAVQPACAVRRPPRGVSHPELDAAWSAYDAKAAAAGDDVHQALVREREAAAGNRDADAEVRRAIDRLERTGRLPLQKGCAGAVGRCRATCEDAWGELAAAYTRAAAALREQKNGALARDVEKELAELRAASRPRPTFVAERFGLEGGATLGVLRALKSWEDVNPVPIFAARRLPALVSDGALVLELHDAHAKGLKRHDVLYSIDGRVLDGEDAYVQMQGALREGQAANATVKRPIRGAWIDVPVTLVPVSRARVEVLHRAKRVYPERSQPPIGIDPAKPADQQRLAEMRLDAEMKLRKQEALVERIFTDEDGFFSDLTLAVAVGSADDIVAMLGELGAERIRAMDALIRETDWGRVRAERDATLTNGKVLLKAWEAVEDVFFPK